MKSRCPLCMKTHDSDDHEIGWVFLCCYRIVWVMENGVLELQIAPGEFEGE